MKCYGFCPYVGGDMRGIALCEEISPTINISTTLGVFILEDDKMAKYIDADELSKRLNDRKYPPSRELPRAVTYNSAIEDALQAVRNMPPADVVEVRHGRWELYDICSVCGAQAEQQTNYCPNCGAKMDYDEDIPMEYFENGGI